MLIKTLKKIFCISSVCVCFVLSACVNPQDKLGEVENTPEQKVDASNIAEEKAKEKTAEGAEDAPKLIVYEKPQSHMINWVNLNDASVKSNAPVSYGILHCERDQEVDEFVRTMADEMLEDVVADPAFFHAEDRDLSNLYILAPFKLWKETETGLVEVEDFFQYPIASNGRVICTIIVTRVGAELHYNVGDIYVRELNLSCNDNRNRVVVFDEEAFEVGDREKGIRLAFLSNDKGDEHDSEANIFLNLSSKYVN